MVITLKYIFDVMSISAGGHFGGIFGPIFYASLFLENGAISYPEIVLSGTLMVTWPKNMSCSPLLGAIFGYFWAHVDICFSISWEPFNIFSWNFVGITLIVTTLTKKIINKFSDHVLLYCQAILAYVPLFLENHSAFSYENVYRCSWYYSDGQFTYFTSCPSLLGAIFRYFWAYFFHFPLFLENCAIFYHEIVYTCAW